MPPNGAYDVGRHVVGKVAGAAGTRRAPPYATFRVPRVIQLNAAHMAIHVVAALYAYAQICYCPARHGSAGCSSVFR